MQLHELNFEIPKGSTFPRCLIPVRGGFFIEVWAQPDYSDYDVLLTTRSEKWVRNRLRVWCEVDAISAQCILHHLLQEHG
jgi:hypothetical protein